MASLRNYTIVLNPNIEEEVPVSGNTVRVLTASVPIRFRTADGSMDFTLEQGEQAKFEEAVFLRLRMSHTSGIAQNVVFSIAEGAEIGSAKFSGNVSVSNAVALDSATLAALEVITVQNLGVSYGASYRSIANLAVNTPETVFAPGANVNGAIVHSASFWGFAATQVQGAFLAKASAPTTVADGDGIVSVDVHGLITGAHGMCGSLKNPVKIPAGKGLYFINNILTAIADRSALYTLL